MRGKQEARLSDAAEWKENSDDECTAEVNDECTAEDIAEVEEDAPICENEDNLVADTARELEEFYGNKPRAVIVVHGPNQERDGPKGQRLCAFKISTIVLEDLQWHLGFVACHVWGTGNVAIALWR